MNQLINPVVVPQSMLECEDRPEKPVSFSDIEIAAAILRYDQAHRDCKSQLRRVGELLAVQGAVK